MEGSANSSSSYKSVDYGSYSLQVTSFVANGNSSVNNNQAILDAKPYLSNCGRYTLLFFQNPTNNQLDYAILTDYYPNGFSIVWQFIQIFVMSLAEILLAISSLAFAFSQAPKTMKPTCLTLRYIAVSLGDLIVLIAAEARYIFY